MNIYFYTNKNEYTYTFGYRTMLLTSLVTMIEE